MKDLKFPKTIPSVKFKLTAGLVEPNIVCSVYIFDINKRSFIILSF